MEAKSKQYLELEDKICTLYDDKIVHYMLSISNKKFGEAYEGGRNMMIKVLVFEGFNDDAHKYHKSLWKDGEPTIEQLDTFYKKLKHLEYIIDRPVENFDDDYGFKSVQEISQVDSSLLQNGPPIPISELDWHEAEDYSAFKDFRLRK